MAHHGYLHEPPATMDPQAEECILEWGLEILETVVGQYPRGYRSPSWDLSEFSIELLASHGFVCDSSMIGDDAPHIILPHGSMVEVRFLE